MQRATPQASERGLGRLVASRHWAFDLDGTLTRPMHDFDALRRAIGCPQGTPILEWLAQQPEPARARKTLQLDTLEAELCDTAQAAEGALALVASLRARGVKLGILTRNTRDNAVRTLQAIGLADAFEPRFVLGRDEAAPKPDPAGLLWLAAQWQVTGPDMVFVGDYLFDLQAGRAAGTATVHVSAGEETWPEHTDVRVRALHECLSLWSA